MGSWSKKEFKKIFFVKICQNQLKLSCFCNSVTILGGKKWKMGKMIIFMEKYTFSALFKKKIILLNWLLRNRHFHEHVERLKILLCRPVCSCIDQWDVMNAVTWHQPTNHSLMQNLWQRRRRRRRNSFGLRVGWTKLYLVFKKKLIRGWQVDRYSYFTYPKPPIYKRNQFVIINDFIKHIGFFYYISLVICR